MGLLTTLYDVYVPEVDIMIYSVSRKWDTCSIGNIVGNSAIPNMSLDR